MIDVYRMLTNRLTTNIRPRTTHGSIINVFLLRAPIMSSVEIKIVMHRFIAKMILTILWSSASIIIIFHSTFRVKIRISEMIDRMMHNIPVSNVPAFSE